MNFNNFDEIIDKIYEMQQASDDARGYRKDIFRHLAKLGEEKGEFSEKMLEDDGYKTNDLDKDEIILEAKKEVIDMMIMTVVLAHQMDMTKDEIKTIFAEKLTKWQSKHIDPLNN
jgi:phosphoribosyl-ATP pyrophosphohydrolase